MKFVLKTFEELNTVELYNLLKLRSEVFVVEQDCPYQDLDDKDQNAHHLLGYESDGQLVAYTRLLDKGISYSDYCSIGRVVIKMAYRKNKSGSILMEESIKHCKRLFNTFNIKISAQYHLIPFYNRLGFKETGNQYLEDNIPHIGMLYFI